MSSENVQGQQETFQNTQQYANNYVYKCSYYLVYYHVSRTVEQFGTYDYRKWGNFKAAYLNFHWLNDSWTCGFELVTRGFELVIREFELVASNS